MKRIKNAIYSALKTRVQCKQPKRCVSILGQTTQRGAHPLLRSMLQDLTVKQVKMGQYIKQRVGLSAHLYSFDLEFMLGEIPPTRITMAKWFRASSLESKEPR